MAKPEMAIYYGEFEEGSRKATMLPSTGKGEAKQLGLKGYNQDSLFDPNINIELGMLYIANLTRATGGPEYAAAAYNAGEDRIALWKSERTYDEVPSAFDPEGNHVFAL